MSWYRDLFQGPARRWTFGIGSVGVILTSLLVAILILRPTPAPDIWDDDVRDVAVFLMDEDFNRLSARDRLKYLLDFMARFREFDQQDAAMLAAVIGEMTRKLREQIEANMRKLVADLMIESAQEYALLDAADRSAFLDKMLLEMDKVGEGFSGQNRDETDAERLARINRQARRDRERAQQRDGGGAVRPERVDRLFSMYNEQVAGQIGAVQRGRIGRLMRDMSRHLRGKPLGP